MIAKPVSPINSKLISELVFGCGLSVEPEAIPEGDVLHPETPTKERTK